MGDGRLVVVYAGSIGKFDMNYRGNREAVQFLSTGQWSEEKQVIEFDRSVSMRLQGHQKNWVPFEYNRTAMFLTSINPVKTQSQF
jgi:hypothetical protein